VVPEGEVLGVSTENTSSQSSQSATSGSAIPTYATPSVQLEVLAGNDRVTTPGSPVSFQATIKKNTAANSGVTFSWSYGDGNVGEGALVSHMYKYPGEYAVVLNAKSGNNFAISRFKVKVLEPKITLMDNDGYVEVVNESLYEVNLFNWKITRKDKAFVFQPDTIILPKSKILIDHTLFKMRGEQEEGLVLKNFLGQEVSRVGLAMSGEERQKLSAKLENAKVEVVALLESRSLAIKQASSVVKPVVPNPSVKGEVAGETVEYQEMLQQGTSSTPLGDIIYESPVKKGFLEKVFGWLTQIFD
jgi:hypothetical protein